MKLRTYQIEIIKKIYSHWQKGSQNVCCQLSTGAGKTVVFCEIVKRHIGYSIIIAHRLEILGQISLVLARNGIYHTIIGQKQIIRDIIRSHLNELNKSFVNPNAKCFIAAVDTLIRLNEPWFNKITLVIQDEAHHVLKDNKWGKAAKLFPNAKGLYPTATPIRADGKGLGRFSDGVIDTLVIGPNMRELITQNYLSDYRIIAPQTQIDLSTVNITSAGDYSPNKLKNAVHKSKIVGDVVQHYIKFAYGKLGITFAVSIKSAMDIVLEFKKYHISAELITSKTPNLLRSQIMQRFKNREILQLVNVDLLGEGVDVPAVECISFARPTQSYVVFAQAFGRALRPLDGKSHAIILDHVGNIFRHGLPDAPKQWTLSHRERRNSSKSDVNLTTCLNPSCLAVYEKINKICPLCGYYTPPKQRSDPNYVAGDLIELDFSTLQKLRGEIKKFDNNIYPPKHLSTTLQQIILNKHAQRQESQRQLRINIARWAGYLRYQNKSKSEIYRIFWTIFKIDIATAQTLNKKDADLLNEKIEATIKSLRSQGNTRIKQNEQSL